MKQQFINLSRDFLTSPAPKGTEIAAPRELSPDVFDALVESLATLNKRLIRMETRLVVFMKADGLDTHGRHSDTF